jgi:arylsulfatase A-like enzyme
VPTGKTVDAMAAGADIAPTLLELAGLPRKDDAQGESLVPLIQEKTVSIHSHVFSEVDIVEPLRSVRDDRYKLILNLRNGRQQLFDYRADPSGAL